MPRRVVDQHSAQKRDGDCSGADDHVLPGRLQCAAGAVMADQERGHDRGRLDRHPQHAEVAGQHGDDHRCHEQVQQDSVPARPSLVWVPGGEVGRAGPAGQQRDRADDEQHATPTARRPGCSPPAIETGPSRTTAARTTASAKTKAVVAAPAQAVARRQPASAYPAAAASGSTIGASSMSVVISRATPAVRRGRCCRTRCAAARSAPAAPAPLAAGRTRRRAPRSAEPRRRQGTRWR